MKPEASFPSPFPGMNWADEAEEQAVLNVLRRGSLFRYYGPGQPTAVAALEERAREFYGTRHALAVNSGSGALLTALAALGIGPGCEVIVPAFMWVATAAAVVQVNAIPVLCEVDDSLTLDPSDLAAKIGPRTKLIIPVHMAGAPCAMDAVMAVAARHGVPVLEDCAQANGGSFRGRKLGTFGALGMFSFQLNKNATAGEGGLIVTDDEALYTRALAAHDLGVPWHGSAPDVAGGVHLWGQGRRMSELCGAVAGVQLGKLPRITEHMRRSKSRIKQLLADIPGLSFRRLNDAEGDTGAFLVFSLADPARATSAAERMHAAGWPHVSRVADTGLHVYSNIPALVQKVPLSPAGNPWSLPANRESVYAYGKGACPASDDRFARSVLVTIPSRLTADQERELADCIRGAVNA